MLGACGSRLPESAFDTTPTTAPTTQPSSARESSAASTRPGPPPSATSATTAPNPASDVGVSPTEIRVGVIVSKSSILGPETFSGPLYGALAYFTALNARGGIGGRNVRPIVCDDKGTGADNLKCVHHLIDDEKVFAFAGNSIFDYAGASYVESKAVPDIGGQPIGNAYDQYSHLYSIYGTDSPRQGTIGWNGTLFGGTEVYRWFKEALGAKVAAVVYYNVAESQRFGNLTVKALQAEGYAVAREQIDLAVPNWDAAAIDMKDRRVDVVFDAIDSAGSVQLCRAIDSARLTIKARALTAQAWTDSVRSDYSQSPRCRNSLYATALERNYMDTQYPAVAQFRQDMTASYPGRDGLLSMWELEGWASAQWLTDAISSCGADLTRACVEAFLHRPDPYDGHGLLIPRDFVVSPQPPTSARSCLNVARWQDQAYNGKGGWITLVPDMDTNCFDVPQVGYQP